MVTVPRPVPAEHRAPDDGFCSPPPGSSIFRLLLLSLVCSVAPGCSQEATPGQAVSGKVVVEGQPLHLGLLTLKPSGATKGPTVTAEIREGQFQIPASRGPWPGEYRALISATPPDVEALLTGAGHDVVRQKAAEPYRVIAKEFNSQTTLRVTVGAGTENRCDFQVRWAPKRR